MQAADRTDLGSPAWLRVATGSPAYEHPRSLLLGACLARATQALLVTFAASSQFEGPRRYSRQQHSVRVCVDQRLPLDVYALIHVYAWINSRWSAVLPFFPICCLHCGASCRRVRFHCTPVALGAFHGSPSERPRSSTLSIFFSSSKGQRAF